MSKNKRMFLAMAGILSVGLVVFAVAANSWKRPPEQPEKRNAVRKVSPEKRNAYLRRSRINPKLAWGLRDFGNRFEKPGNERALIVGTLQTAGDANARPVEVINEFPERIRLTISTNHKRQTIVFNHGEIKNAAPLTDIEKSLMDTLSTDSTEHFFWTQMEAQATRFLGDKYRLDDGSSTNYDGPYYDVYQVMDESTLNAQGQPVPKFFYINTSTFLLDRIVYQSVHNSKRVEVLLSDWRKQNGQSTPFRIERFEDGQSVFVFTVKSVHFGPRVEDATFSSVSGN